MGPAGPPRGGRRARITNTHRNTEGGSVTSKTPDSTNRQSAGRTGGDRAILIAVDRGLPADLSADEYLDELAQLIETAGGTAVGRVIQRRQQPDSAYYLGAGKLEEAVQLLRAEDGNLVVADDELTPAQVRNLENTFEVRVIDRSQVILDIFAQRARTREGRLQVELAQLRYALPRLTGRGVEMSRLAGGIGTRGPGETKLETDRRRIRRRIAALRREVEEVRRHRTLQRRSRAQLLFPVAALVGYTNAGKTTLLSALTGDAQTGEDRLFATLDPMIRALDPRFGRNLLVVDTVGFINKLPHELIAAFRATLEELVHADVLVHVIDISNPRWETQAATVQRVLRELGVEGYPVVTAFNKVDRLQPDDGELARALRLTPHGVAVSAATGFGLEALLDEVERVLPDPWERWELNVPYAEGHVVDWIHKFGRVHRLEYGERGVALVVDLPRSQGERVKKYRLT